MRVEEALKSNMTSSPSSWSLRKRINVCVTVAISTALLEHLMSLTSHSLRTTYEAEMCNWTQHNIVEDIVSKHLNFIYSAIEYNYFLLIISEYTNVSCTFYWSFIDIFIVVISIGMAFNYQQINQRMKYFKERIVPDEVWFGFRKQYNEVSELLKYVDDEMGNLLLLSCFNDSYFIMVQLLNAAS